MSSAAPTSEPGSTGDNLTLAFAPLHKRAFGTAVGITVGGVLFLITAVSILRGNPPDALFAVRYVLPLYDVTWTGAVLGSLSAALAAFCAGWFLAFCRNIVIALGVWSVRTRAELAQTRDFLDHI